eukprot:TRINITY_DN10656_c0_g1_i1.p1 TRINITY_DN10656_c0_g1~~TRINITY_DN10656_c0_g1_i1.p1  ORF type:complete len:521 (-),score=26.32 TRINITY_DN10656_c0_g1_i1:160-1656(-)
MVIYYCYPAVKFQSKKRLPPEPAGLPLVGNLWTFIAITVAGRPHESLWQLSKIYGPIFSLKIGVLRSVVISSPSMAKEILKTHDSVFSGRIVPQVNRSLSLNESSLFFSQGGSSYWRLVRKISSNYFSNAKTLRSFAHLRRLQVGKMLARVAEASGAVDIGETVFVCMLNLVGNMVFGDDMFDSESKEFAEFRKAACEFFDVHGTPNVADFFPFLQRLDPQRLKRRCERALTKIYGIVDSVIEGRLKEGAHLQAEHRDYLATLLEARNQGLTLDNIRGILAETFNAGGSSVSSTVQWAMAELMKNPPMLHKATQEIDDQIGKQRRIEEDEAESLNYLRCVVKETLRFHPSVPILVPHRAEEDTDIGGYCIPENSQMIVNVWAIGRDPKVWRNAEEFDPERFAENEIDYRGQHFELIPFGAGRRMCTGMPMASKMIGYLLASLLQSFQWSLPDEINGCDLDMSDTFGTILRKATPLRLLAKPRLPLHLYGNCTNNSSKS